MSIPLASFEAACQTLLETWRSIQSQTEWKDMKLSDNFGSKYLTIRAEVKLNRDESGKPESAEIEELDNEQMMYESDEEIVQLEPRPSCVEPSTVTYYIVHSPSYQVPVLYPAPDQLTQSHPDLLDEIQRSLVPSVRLQQVKCVGVLGALSMTDHPVTGLPTCFVHPCKTQEAMSAVIGGREVAATEYLMLWFGVIAGSVGLNLPLEIAVALQQRPCNGGAVKIENSNSACDGLD